MFLLHNFKAVLEEKFRLTFNNRGFQYNDGFFETLILHRGKIRFLDDHLDRIAKAMEVLGLASFPQLNAGYLQAEIPVLAQRNNLNDDTIRVKLNIWRKPGGLFTPESDMAEILISVQPQPAFSPIISQADFYTGTPNRFTPFSFFKGPYALHYVQASLARKKAGLDELILVDEKGNVSECLVSNIFWIKGSQVFTPTLETGCIAGIMRLNVLKACQMLKINATEGFYSPTDLLTADAVLTSNVTGLRSIKCINQLNFGTGHPLFGKLQQLILA